MGSAVPLPGCPADAGTGFGRTLQTLQGSVESSHWRGVAKPSSGSSSNAPKSHGPSSLLGLTFPAQPEAVASYPAAAQRAGPAALPPCSRAETRQEKDFWGQVSSLDLECFFFRQRGRGWPRTWDQAEAVSTVSVCHCRQMMSAREPSWPRSLSRRVSWWHCPEPCFPLSWWQQRREAQGWLILCFLWDAPCPAAQGGQGRVGAASEGRETWDPPVLWAPSPNLSGWASPGCHILGCEHRAVCS